MRSRRRFGGNHAADSAERAIICLCLLGARPKAPPTRAVGQNEKVALLTKDFRSSSTGRSKPGLPLPMAGGGCKDPLRGSYRWPCLLLPLAVTGRVCGERRRGAGTEVVWCERKSGVDLYQRRRSRHGHETPRSASSWSSLWLGCDRSWRDSLERTDERHRAPLSRDNRRTTRKRCTPGTAEPRHGAAELTERLVRQSSSTVCRGQARRRALPLKDACWESAWV